MRRVGSPRWFEGGVDQSGGALLYLESGGLELLGRGYVVGFWIGESVVCRCSKFQIF